MKRQRLILTEVNYISESILLSNQTNLVCHGNAPEISGRLPRTNRYPEPEVPWAVRTG